MKVILFANVRDEIKIKEWIIHHLLLGFDMIYLFDHKSIVPLSEQLTCFGDRVFVKRCIENGAIKIKLMNIAAKVALRLRADWMIYLDADEFIVINNRRVPTIRNNIKDLLDKFYFADSVAFQWLMFGTSYHKTDPPGLIIENYTRSNAKLDQHVKTFVRPNQIINSEHPHFYNIKNPKKMVALNGNNMGQTRHFNKNEIPFTSALGFIAHYVYQSEETYKRRKLMLPRDDNAGFRNVEPNLHDQYNEKENTLVRDIYANNMRTYIKNNNISIP
jgi:hypothetical protein